MTHIIGYPPLYAARAPAQALPAGFQCDSPLRQLPVELNAVSIPLANLGNQARQPGAGRSCAVALRSSCTAVSVPLATPPITATSSRRVIVWITRRPVLIR